MFFPQISTVCGLLRGRSVVTWRIDDTFLFPSSPTLTWAPVPVIFCLFFSSNSGAWPPWVYRKRSCLGGGRLCWCQPRVHWSRWRSWGREGGSLNPPPSECRSYAPEGCCSRPRSGSATRQNPTPAGAPRSSSGRKVACRSEEAALT